MEGINYHICIVARIAVQTDCQVLLLSIYVHLDISQASRKPSSHFWPFLKGITVSNIKEIVFEQKGMLVASLRCQDRSEQNLRQDWAITLDLKKDSLASTFTFSSLARPWALRWWHMAKGRFYTSVISFVRSVGLKGRNRAQSGQTPLSKILNLGCCFLTKISEELFGSPKSVRGNLLYYGGE